MASPQTAISPAEPERRVFDVDLLELKVLDQRRRALFKSSYTYLNWQFFSRLSYKDSIASATLESAEAEESRDDSRAHREPASAQGADGAGG